MTADQLRELLERRDSPTSGTKRELVTRLREAIASPAEAAELHLQDFILCFGEKKRIAGL